MKSTLLVSPHANGHQVLLPGAALPVQSVTLHRTAPRSAMPCWYWYTARAGYSSTCGGDRVLASTVLAFVLAVLERVPRPEIRNVGRSMHRCAYAARLNQEQLREGVSPASLATLWREISRSDDPASESWRPPNTRRKRRPTYIAKRHLVQSPWCSAILHNPDFFRPVPWGYRARYDSVERTMRQA